MPQDQIILASTSVFRRRSLRMLGVKFGTMAPAVDETPRPHEGPRALARRLARAKALAVAARRPRAIVIGGDQTLAANGRIYGKPGSRAAAVRMLNELSGQRGIFYSAICVARAGELREACVPTTVVWRRLTPRQIRNYVAREPSFASAGGAQLEKLGIALLESMRSDDPSAVIGLPLIELGTILASFGRGVLD
ncbi:MAG: septum formation protein Maf [Betaproteobacteria bacterium AqS2]|uniref:7-methyl-GTP pyrophosphatase n=1 Tax=Candidatus Amphirhobacter heronislandensis TaxID=1732024 RepID=A0A930UCM5_9GAMM|nr:septum formation protein Maf [Betaproteobacteria bacterium AqS2]